ncbi:MAG: ribbon-helix-helix protein, CopG family [Acidobacteriaceae bacterium]|nr:ribbon-helix-helix protein, CopG family [Acidobacteriaceae bacterium]MBV9225531.1 ribbon-helix-helix protein, CopG family [Acidobacteriaceae bacterium]MBV9679850.1 ribbon-helix-helix protein, CopG family [Acidobacteriaceae bacterium]
MASRNISISLPEEMIQQANQLAMIEQRTLSELFREAFRVYRAQHFYRKAEEADKYPRTQTVLDDRGQELARIAKELRAEIQK